MDKIEVLIVDDEKDFCKHIELFLIKKEKYLSHSVHNGEDAVAFVKNNKPDIVLLDIRMPGIDGIETLCRIKDVDKDCSVIMLTADNEISSAISAFNKGADSFLRKPVNLVECIHSIESSLEKRRLINENKAYKINLEDKVKKKTQKLKNLFFTLKKTNFEIIRALAEAIEAKDPYTRGHCNRVTQFSLAIGKKIGLTKVQMENIEYGGVLHDIGKIGIRGAVLNKNGKLTDEEYDHIKTHPLVGVKILKNIDFLQGVLPIVRHHHERTDGKGYPDGLSDFELNILPKIVSIADAYDAMVSDRPYRKALSTEKAKGILIENSGSQFNTELVNVFLSTVLL